jgi:hypothetical protein
MKIYFDTEFTSLDSIVDYKLISAGFVAENGQEFYVELTKHYSIDECSNFVQEAVLPHLDHKTYGMVEPQARLYLKQWFQSFKEEVVLCSDAPGYDFPLIYDLCHKNKNWAHNLRKMPANVGSHFVEQGIENYFQYQPMAIRHHALWDARALAAAVKAYETGIRY